MDKLVIQQLPANMSALPVDLSHPNRALISGLFRETATVAGQKRDFLTYIPADLEYCQPCLVVVPPSSADAVEFIQSSGLVELAEAKRLYLHALIPSGPWQDDAHAADFANAAYAAVQGRDSYVTMQDNIYLCGFGDGAFVAHQAASRMASEWSGLFTFGELDGRLCAPAADKSRATEQGALELKIEAKQAQLPVWLVVPAESENVRAAVEYWKGQNGVSRNEYSGSGANRIWMPEGARKFSEVNEEHIAQVRLTTGSCAPSLKALETVWAYVGGARRHRGFGKKILRAFKDPIACGATKHETVHNGMARLWYEYVPAACTPDKKWPLVLCMHGRGGTAETFFDISGMSAVAEERKFIVAFPQAGLHQQKPNGLKNVLFWCGDRDGVPEDDVGFLRALVADMQSRLPVDAGRIYSTGQSSGGMMTDVLWYAASDLFAACASWSGMFHPKKIRCRCPMTEPVLPTLFICGEDDAICTSKTPDPDLPFNLIPELKADILFKLERYGLKLQAWETWTCEPVTWWCWRDAEGVPLLTVGIVKDMAHANYPEESWITWDEYLCQFSKDEQGRLLWRGKVVKSVLRESK